MDNVLISFLGSRLDHAGLGKGRLLKWRPSVSLTMHPELPISRYYLLFLSSNTELLKATVDDIQLMSPGIEVIPVEIKCTDPWDLADVYTSLLDAISEFNIGHDEHQYLVNITTGTHIVQISMFMLVEAKIIRGKLIQSSRLNISDVKGSYQIIDLDLSRYDKIASRYAIEAKESETYLKNGIPTKNIFFNNLITQIEKVSVKSNDPILLMGPTGAGKSQLARKIYDLKKIKGLITGNFVEINCATLRGDSAMSTMFGHKKGAFTGAANARSGLLLEADKGVVFLDEIGELPSDEQAMLLRAIETGEFLPVGSDKTVTSDFQVIAGTNRDLLNEVSMGKFREDLFARLNMWTYTLPSLKERIEDFEPNLNFELNSLAQKYGRKIKFTRKAKDAYLNFAKSEGAIWCGNFRDLNASVRRMAVLSDSGLIEENDVAHEVVRLKTSWGVQRTSGKGDFCEQIEYIIQKLPLMDSFDVVQLRHVLLVCKNSDTLAEAGRVLFSVSRGQKSQKNDSHRLKQYLSKFNLEFAGIKKIIENS